MTRGDVATLIPPGDIRNHGHVRGTGPSPYSLILLGDDMYLFDREEYDPGHETWRKLAPGDPGQSHRLYLSRRHVRVAPLHARGGGALLFGADKQ
jgi:hypothetical protein